jgi:hypothetical protein
MWTYEGYWNTVLGADRMADDVCREFRLDPRDRRTLDDWLCRAEAEAWAQGGGEGEIPAEWWEHHCLALDELVGVTYEMAHLED